MVMRVNSFERWLIIAALVAVLSHQATASLGDHLPEFRECVKASMLSRT